MKRAYLFIYDDGVGTREEITKIFNTMPAVITWRFDMPHAYYIVSENSAEELYAQFIIYNGKKGKFMFVETGSNRQGLMLSEAWHILNHKTHKPKDTPSN